jgi:outer membrane protein assembly factor BamB
MMKFKDTDMFGRFFISIVGLVLVFAGVEGFGQSQEQGFLISPVLLKHSGMEMQWQLNLPIKPAEKVERLFVFDEYLYVLTDHNYLFCLERVKGTLRFEQQLAVAGLPVCEPKYYQGKLNFVVGNELLVLDPAAGAISEKRKLKGFGKGSVCGIARNSAYLYVVGSDRRIRALVAGEYWEKFSVSADNDSLINSLVVDDELIIFATETGNVVKVLSEGPAKKWQFDIPGTIKAPIVRDGESLYVGSENTKLYKLDINTGQKLWPVDFQTGAVLTESAIIGKKAVYQYASDKGLYAIEKEGGEKAWQVENGIGILTEKGGRAYVLAKEGVLVVMDNDSGEQLYSVNVSAVNRHATNMTDSAIYVSDDKGRLMGIKIKD